MIHSENEGLKNHCFLACWRSRANMCFCIVMIDEDRCKSVCEVYVCVTGHSNKQASFVTIKLNHIPHTGHKTPVLPSCLIISLIGKWVESGTGGCGLRRCLCYRQSPPGLFQRHLMTHYPGETITTTQPLFVHLQFRTGCTLSLVLH